MDVRGLRDDLWATLPRFRRHNGLHLSAGVSFYTLLSLAPLFYLAVALIGRVTREVDVTDRMLRAVQMIFPGVTSESLNSIANGLRTDDPLVLVALPALIWVASTVIASLELAVNVAFQREHLLTVLSSRLKSFVLLSLGLLMLLVSLVTATLLPGAERFLWNANALPEGVRLAGTLSRGLILAAPVLFFATFYKVLPRGRVRWRAAAWGAGLAWLLWETTRHLFANILAHSPALGLLSGVLSGIVTVLLWVQAAVVLLLLGAEFAALRQERFERVVSVPKTDD